MIRTPILILSLFLKHLTRIILRIKRLARLVYDSHVRLIVCIHTIWAIVHLIHNCARTCITTAEFF